MKFACASALTLVLLSSERALAQSESRATAFDSLSAAQRYAQICPGPRDAGTGAIIGRVRDLDDSTALGNATVSTQWIDLKDTNGHLANASAKTNSSGLFLLCGVPAQQRLNLRAERGGYVGSPAQAALDDRLIGRVDFGLRRMGRAASDTSSRTQSLATVAIDAKAVLPSWSEQSGFDARRLQALGAFVTAQDIAKRTYSDLTSVLQGIRGINIERSGRGGIASSTPYMMGVMSVHGNQSRCLPNVFLDGAQFRINVGAAGYDVLGDMVHPESIKGIEVYTNPGTIPAQFDLMSSTGCGSIVIWTR
jgi:hypothetical protein